LWHSYKRSSNESLIPAEIEMQNLGGIPYGVLSQPLDPTGQAKTVQFRSIEQSFPTYDAFRELLLALVYCGPFIILLAVWSYTRAINKHVEVASQEFTTVRTRMQQQAVEAILNGVSDPAALITPHGLIESINRSACTLFGYSREELTDQPVMRFFSDETKKAAKSIDRITDATCVTKQGERLDAAVFTEPLRHEDGKIWGYLCFIKPRETKKPVESA
jgi:PAS domain S-box-containing protein